MPSTVEHTSQVSLLSPRSPSVGHHLTCVASGFQVRVPVAA
jgi:hypothetical protein